jgi:hypothetical protein
MTRRNSISSARVSTVSEIKKRIRSAGYWETIVRPARFVRHRIEPITALLPLLRRCHVEVRGWDFPHISDHDPIITGADFVEQESEWQHHAEAWRLYQTGQFVDLRGMPNDWRDRSDIWPTDDGWQRGDRLGIGDTLFIMFEAFEFSARFAHAMDRDDPLVVQIKAGGLKGRRLYVDDPMRLPLRDEPIAHIETYSQRLELSRAQVMTDPVALAIRAAQELFRRFGREFPDSTLRDWLEKSMRR